MAGNHYVDNKRFYQCLVRRWKDCIVAETRGKRKPRVTNEVGNMLLAIATNTRYRRTFITYSQFHDEMIGDSVENCIRYIDNFNVRKYKNPFAYFTQVAYYASIRRIVKETKSIDIRKKLMERSGLDFDEFGLNEFDMTNHYDVTNRQQENN